MNTIYDFFKDISKKEYEGCSSTLKELDTTLFEYIFKYASGKSTVFDQVHIENGLKLLTNKKAFEIDSNRNVDIVQDIISKIDSGTGKKKDAFLKCKKCKSTSIEWIERQTRSADESATIFLHCTNCNSRWKQ